MFSTVTQPARRIITVAVIAAAAFALAACGSSTPPATEASSSTSAAPSTTTAKVAAPTTTASSAAAVTDPIIQLAADYKAPLAAFMSLPACDDPLVCVQQHTAITNEVAEFKTAATAAGVDLAAYPKVAKAYNDLVTTVLDFDGPSCGLAPAGSTTALTCAVQVLNAKMRAQTLSLNLDTAAIQAQG
jgi:hypothetical protein